MVVAQQDGVKVRVIRLGSEQQRVWRTPAPPVLILMKLTYLMPRRWIKNKLLGKQTKRPESVALFSSFWPSDQQDPASTSQGGSCEKERYIASLITRKTRGKRSWCRNSAFIKRRGRGCRQDRQHYYRTLWKGCVSKVCRAADWPSSRKKNGFDEMQMSTFTQNLPPHLSPRSPRANEGTHCWLVSVTLRSCK